MDFALFDALSNLEQADGVIALPLGACYRLAAHPGHPQALARMRRILGKDAGRLLLIGYDADAFHPFIATPGETTARLMKRHWPGALEILLERELALPEGFEGGNPTIMQPDSKLARDLLSLIPGGVLALSEAARYGRQPAETAGAVFDTFGDDVDYVLQRDAEIDPELSTTLVSVDGNGNTLVLRSGRVVLD